MTRRISRARGRMLALLVLSIALLGSALAPASASAIAVPPCHLNPAYCAPYAYRTAPLGYQGWTFLNLNHCPYGLVCAAVYRDSIPAWRWTGSSWEQTTISQGWTYVHPYTGSWRWAWTQKTGWLAVSGGRFEIRDRYHGVLR